LTISVARVTIRVSRSMLAIVAFASTVSPMKTGALNSIVWAR